MDKVARRIIKERTWTGKTDVVSSEHPADLMIILNAAYMKTENKDIAVSTVVSSLHMAKILRKAFGKSFMDAMIFGTEACPDNRIVTGGMNYENELACAVIRVKPGLRMWVSVADYNKFREIRKSHHQDEEREFLKQFSKSIRDRF